MSDPKAPRVYGKSSSSPEQEEALPSAFEFQIYNMRLEQPTGSVVTGEDVAKNVALDIIFYTSPPQSVAFVNTWRIPGTGSPTPLGTNPRGATVSTENSVTNKCTVTIQAVEMVAGLTVMIEAFYTLPSSLMGLKQITATRRIKVAT